MIIFPRAVFRNVPKDTPSQLLKSAPTPRSASIVPRDEKQFPRLQFTLSGLQISTTLCGIVAAARASSNPDTDNAISATLSCTPFVGGLLLSTWAGFVAGLIALVAMIFFDETVPFLGAIIYFGFWLWLPMFCAAFLGTLCRRWLLRRKN